MKKKGDGCPAPNQSGIYDPSVAQQFGQAWLRERRSALLLVPSAVTAGLDTNAVINPDHPDAAHITVTAEAPVTLDPRLFG